MMVTDRWRLYALHILDCIEKIVLIQARGNMAEDSILYDASLRNLQTLSESTQRLPDSLKSQFPEIPWLKISGFRNILVHEYLGSIDALTVLRVIEVYLPPLKSAVLSMLATHGEG
jgi:uncharacterized protein with HEPN domain